MLSLSFSRQFASAPSLCLLIIFQLVSNVSLSQQAVDIDSLKRVLESRSGHGRYEPLFKLAYELFDVDNQEAIIFARDAYVAAKQLGDSLEIVKSGRLNGQIERRVGNLNASIHVLNQVLPIAQRNRFTIEEFRILNALAIAHTFKANYDEALTFHFQSLKISEEENKKGEISITLNNIGLIYYKLRSFEKAIQFYERCLQIKKEIKDSVDIDMLFVNIGLCYNQLGKVDKSQAFFKKSLDVFGKGCSDQTKLHAYFGMGMAYYGTKNYKKAKDYFTESHSLASKNSDGRFQADNLAMLGRIYEKENDTEAAISFFIEAEKVADKGEYNETLIQVYNELFKIYDQSKDGYKTIDYLKKYISLKDSVYSKELMNGLMDLEADYQERAHLQIIEAKQQLLELKESVINQQHGRVKFILIISSLLVVLLILLYWRYKDKRSANQILETKVKERTQELEFSRDQLQRIIDNQHMLINEGTLNINAPLATMKGICHVALKDLPDKTAREYIGKLEASTDDLIWALSRFIASIDMRRTASSE